MAKVELECAVYGEGTVFSVKITRDAKVEALQKAIAEILSTDQHAVAPRLVTLYLAKKNGVWLKSDPTLKPFLKQGRQTNDEYVVEMIPNWKLNKTEYFGDFQFGEEDIHVLVELPETVAKTMTPVMMTFVEKMFAEIFVKVVPSTVPSKLRSFKEKLLNYYGYNDPTNQRRRDYGFMGKKSAIRCMLTNDFFPASIVIASHLFRYGWKSYSKEAMDLDDIDDPKNGLLLFKPLEKAFDEYRISFLYNRSSEKYELKVVDSSWKDKTLISQLNTLQLKELRMYGRKTSFNFQTTFGSLEGFPLILRPDKLPYNRCLNFQARLARHYALKSGRMKEDEPDFQDFWSDTFTPSETIEWLAQSISDMSVNPELRAEFFDTEEEKDE
jgi:hypothetical protein